VEAEGRGAIEHDHKPHERLPSRRPSPHHGLSRIR
jgi:hypothetical protein